jgi:hypothetical protein
MNLVARGFYTAELSHMTALVYLPVCKSTSAWGVFSVARGRACVRELWDLAPDVRPELGSVVYIQRVLLLGK